MTNHALTPRLGTRSHWTQAGDAAHYFAMLHRAKCHLAAEGPSGGRVG